MNLTVGSGSRYLGDSLFHSNGKDPRRGQIPLLSTLQAPAYLLILPTTIPLATASHVAESSDRDQEAQCAHS